MAATGILDIIQPEVFTPYVTERTMEQSALVRSGIIVNNKEFDALASGPNTLVNMPYWEDLDGDPETINGEGYFEPLNINANKDVARKCAIGNMWGANNLTALLSGDDPMAAIGNLVSDYWQRKMQQMTLATTAGIFEASSMADKVHDISGESGNSALITGETFIDAGQKMGDAKEFLTAVMMHSAVEAHLAKRKLIEYVQESEQSERVPYFMRKRVIVDDSMPLDTSAKTATAYLFGNGAIALGNGSHPKMKAVETARDSTSLAGEDYLVNRKIFIMHPRGVKWTEKSVEGDFPTKAELAMGQNWERVYESKKIRIVKFRFKIG